MFLSLIEAESAEKSRVGTSNSTILNTQIQHTCPLFSTKPCLDPLTCNQFLESRTRATRPCLELPVAFLPACLPSCACCLGVGPNPMAPVCSSVSASRSTLKGWWAPNSHRCSSRRSITRKHSALHTCRGIRGQGAGTRGV